MSIKREMARGASWLILLRMVVRGISFVSTLILARLLVPADFGLVAMATAVITLIEMLGDFGFHVYLVQKESLTKQDLDTAWTVQMSIAAFEALVLAMLALPLAEFYSEPRLPAVIWVLSVNTVLIGLKNVGIIHFQRDMRFHLEFKLRATSKLAGFVVTVVLAYFLRTYWALIIGSVALRVTEVGLSYTLHRHRPRFRIAGCREIFTFSKWVYWNTTLNFLGQRSPDFVIGKMAGADALGFFSVAYGLAMLPTSEMAGPINRATFPGYAKMRDDRTALQDGYLSVFGIIALVTIPVGFGMAATAEALIPLLLGAKWSAAIPIVKILGFAGVLAALQSNTGSLFFGRGRPWVMTWLAALRITILVPCVIILTSTYGAIGAAAGFLATYLAVYPVGCVMVLKSLKLRLRTLLSVLYRPIFASIVMYSVLYFCLSNLVISLGDGWQILGGLGLIMTGGIIYLACILLFWKAVGKPNGSAEEVIIGIIREQVLKGIATRYRRAQSIA